MENSYADPVIYMKASCLSQVHQIINHVVRLAHFLNVTGNKLHVLMYVKIVEKIVNNEKIRE